MPSTLTHLFSRFRSEAKGAAAIEEGRIVSMVAIQILIALGALSLSVPSLFADLVAAL